MMKTMKVILLTLAFYCLSATVFAQNITLNISNVTVKEAIQTLKEKTGYSFIYEVNDIDTQRKISVKSANKPIDEVVKQILAGQQVAYEITGKSIVLTRKKEAQKETEQKTVKVNGIVSDTNGDPIIGVSISVKGTTSGTISDVNGKFTIEAAGNATLKLTYIGYLAKEVAINNQTDLKISMSEDTKALDEVVVVGYGTQKKGNMTGAVSQVKMEQILGDRPLMNTTSALQGAVPGLQITRNSTPGQNSNSLNIRGTLSINGGSPLVLIDGAPGEISMLNPDDIESVSVLKDAASAAIYGARAANGVVLVNTKRPQSGAKFKLEYNTYYGLESSINNPKQASLTEYLQAYIDAGFTNTYWSNSQDVKKWMGYVNDYKANPSAFNTIGDGIYVDNGTPYYLNEKDLFKNFLTTGLTKTHNVAASGGTETLRYRISAGYNDEDGPMITNKDFYKRLNAGALISADVNKWFTQEINIRYAQSTKNMYVDEVGSLYALNLISYYPEGDMPASLSMNHEDTPLVTPRNIIQNSNAATTTTDNPHVMIKSIFKPFKDLIINAEYTFDKNSSNYNYYSGKFVFTSIQLGEQTKPTKDYLVKQRYFTNQDALNIYANYSKTIGDHHFSAMGGFNQESYYYENVNNRAETQAVPSVPSFGGATGVVTNTDNYSEYSSRSGFYRLNYNYKNKYLFETNGRYDGSSKFPTDSRFGFFPSVSAGWQMGKEGFMEFANNWLHEFKLRGSYGSIGNQAINPYQYSPDMSLGKSNIWADNMQLVTYIGTPSLVSSNFTWETVTTLDFGVDFSLFKNKLIGTFDWYQRDTKDMLTAGTIQLPATVGASAPTQNSASLQTKGWELSVNWSDKIGKLGYRFGFNLYDRTSKITKYDNNESGLISNYYVGQNLGEIWGYLNDGYYTVDDFSDTKLWKLKDGVAAIEGYNVKPGDVKFKNLNDDAGSTNLIDGATSTLTDAGDRKIIGNTTARFQFGSNFGLNYAGFDLNVMLQGVGKRDYWLSDYSIFPFGGMAAAGAVFQPVFYNQTDYWKPISTDVTSPDYMVAQNPNAKLFRIYNQMENVGSNTRASDKYIQNAAYLRVKLKCKSFKTSIDNNSILIKIISRNIYI
jgi:TonB-linked SusC/RagA family outer membrane protein